MPAPRPDITTVDKPSPTRRTQTLFTYVAVAAAFIWCIFNVVRGDQSVFNPGHVAGAHKSFEQQCWQCHDGGPNGLISQKVSDTACLKCHRAAIHSVNQKLGVAHSHAELVVAVSGDSTYPHGMRSSDCSACHVEHKGLEVLKSKTEETCIRCHANVKDFAATPSSMANSITEFSKDKHPDFGRTLLVSGKYQNKTVLKFNHLAHQANAGTCEKCHKESPTNPGYMLPISYEANCAECHKMSILEGDLSEPIAHPTDMAMFRKELAGLPAEFLDSAAHANNSLELRYKKKNTLPAVAARRAAALRQALAAHPEDFLSPEEYLQKQFDAFAAQENAVSDKAYPQLQNLRKTLGKAPPMQPTTLPVAPTTAPSLIKVISAPNADLVEFYMESDNLKSRVNCEFCHALSGELPSVVTAGKPGDMQLIATTPTNIATVTFAASKFNHDKHTEKLTKQTCISCHTEVYDYKPVPADSPKVDASNCKAIDGALRLKDPQIWTTEQLAESSRLLSPTAISTCTSCHNPASTTGFKASSSCYECHDYHDRKLQTLPNTLPGTVAAIH